MTIKGHDGVCIKYIKCFPCRVESNNLVQISVWDKAPVPGFAPIYQYSNVFYTSGQEDEYNPHVISCHFMTFTEFLLLRSIQIQFSNY
jgi:hypothetical protein